MNLETVGKFLERSFGSLIDACDCYLTQRKEEHEMKRATKNTINATNGRPISEVVININIGDHTFGNPSGLTPGIIFLTEDGKDVIEVSVKDNIVEKS